MCRMRMHIRLFVAVLSVATWMGCTPTEDDAVLPGQEAAETPQAPSPEDIAKAEAAEVTFADCVANAQSRMEDAACREAAETLARYGGPPLEHTLRKLDDPNVDPYGKLIIVEAFKGKVNPMTHELLVSMTAADKDPMTRRSATALLASAPTVDTVTHLITLSSDPDPKLSFTALLGIVPGTQEDSEFRKRFVELYSNPETQPNMQEHIVATISQYAYAADEPVLIDAIQNDKLSPAVREAAAAALGRVGGVAAVEPLKRAQQNRNVSTEFLDAVTLSLTAIEERLEAEGGLVTPLE